MFYTHMSNKIKYFFGTAKKKKEGEKYGDAKGCGRLPD